MPMPGFYYTQFQDQKVALLLLELFYLVINGVAIKSRKQSPESQIEETFVTPAGQEAVCSLRLACRLPEVEIDADCVQDTLEAAENLLWDEELVLAHAHAA